MWLFFLLFFPLATPANANSRLSGGQEKFRIPFPGGCGLVTRYSPNQIPPGCLQSALNMLFDDDNTVLRRNGLAKYNATPCQNSQSVRGLWPFYATDGTKYLVIFSSQTMFQTKGAGDCTAITGLSGLSQTAEMQCIQTIGRLWCTDGTDPVFSWNGSSTQTITAAPLGTLIGAFRNRVIIGNVGGNQTRIYGSGELDGTDWTLFIPGKSTTSFVADLSGTNDGLPAKCFLGEYQGGFLVARDYDLYGLYGNDRRDFSITKISNQIGCLDPKSVSENNNTLMWLSHRGIEQMSGTTINRISDPIRPNMDVIINAAGNSQSKTYKTQSDFQAGLSNACASGNGGCISTTLNPGNIVPSSWSITHTAGTDFQTWSSTVNISTQVSPGFITLAVSSPSFTNASSLTNWTFGRFSPSLTPDNRFGWQGTAVYGTGSDTTCTPDITPVNSSQVLLGANVNCANNGPVGSGNSDTLIVNVIGADGLAIATATYSPPFTVGCTTATITLSTTNYIPDSVPISVVVHDSFNAVSSGFTSQDAQLKSPGGALPGASINYAFRFFNDGNGVCQAFFNFNAAPEYYASGQIVSAGFNTTFSTPTWGPFNATISSGPDTGVTIQTQVASDGVTYDAAISTSPGYRVTSAQKQYIQYVSTFTTNVSTKTPTITNIGLSAETTGYYISDCVNPGASISSWGNFQTAFQTNNGTLTYYISTGTSCNQVTRTTVTWNTQVANSAISVPTATFAAARILFSMDSATETPTVNNFTFNWNIGSARPPTGSVVYRDRYFLFYTSSTATGAVNDHALVYDVNGKWTLFDDVSAYVGAIYQNKLYIGSSKNDGTIYQLDTGNDDNGSNYVYSLQTSDMDMGSPDSLKLFQTLYIAFQPQAQFTPSIPVSVSYNLDGSTVSYNLGTVNMNEGVEQSGYFIAKLYFPITTGQPIAGHWINLSLSNTGNQGPIRMYWMELVYEKITED